MMPTATHRSHTRRAAAAAAVAAAATLGIVACGNDSDGDGAAHRQTLRLQSQLAASPRGAPTGREPGSPLLFNGMLFKPEAGPAIGRSQASCTRTANGAGDVFQCLLSFVLDDGMIYAQSTSSSRGPAGGVVTGGTRRYANVRGTFGYAANGTARVDLTFRLVG
jgi:hypothetical protein